MGSSREAHAPKRLPCSLFTSQGDQINHEIRGTHTPFGASSVLTQSLFVEFPAAEVLAQAENLFLMGHILFRYIARKRPFTPCFVRT
jgi:hypothetical protein